jgi:hypothetical protein
MKRRLKMKLHGTNKSRMFAMTLLAALALPVVSFAQEQKEKRNEHHHYKLIDIGTFGGPNSSFVGPPPSARLLNNSGAAVGGADTSTPDPASCFNFDCYLSYGFKWQDGVAHKLGALPRVGTKSNRKHPICERINCASLCASNDLRVGAVSYAI